MTVPRDVGERARASEIAGESVALVGRFAAVGAREVAQAVVRRGGTVDADHPSLVVLGDLATAAERERARKVASHHGVEIVEEAAFWSRLGLMDVPPEGGPSYSPAALAEVVGVPPSTVRRWMRCGLLEPRATFGGLGCLDFAEARLAKSLADLLKGGVSLSRIERAAEQLAAAYPEVRRPLADLPLRAIDGEVVVAVGERRADTTGQQQFPFDRIDCSNAATEPEILTLPDASDPVVTHRRRAWRLYNEGDVDAAIEAWRLTLLEAGPSADDHFVLAEWLEESGREDAARERLYATLELDEEHIEARVVLARSLWRMGDRELAIATLEGALRFETENSDLHFELAHFHSAHGDEAAARPHWRRFAELAPTDPRLSSEEPGILSAPMST